MVMLQWDYKLNWIVLVRRGYSTLCSQCYYFFFILTATISMVGWSLGGGDDGRGHFM